MPNITAFIFDLDGVITDTAEYHFLAWKRLADEEGLAFSRTDNEQLRGVSRRESLLRLLKGKSVSEQTMEAWMTRKNAYYLDFLSEITPANLLSGVMDFLQSAQALGLKLGIGSASKNAKIVIERLQIGNLFQVIGDGYAVSNSKPAPDLFIWVAGGLQTPVYQAVVFEDAESGISAAKAAGCYSVGLGTASVQQADISLASLQGVSVTQVLKHLAAR
jgi:beta-phosphoglucomutase